MIENEIIDVTGTPEKINILASYPRSGNTWIRYCVEYLTKYPTRGMGRLNMRELPLGETFNMGVDLNKPFILHKVHRTNKYREDKTNKLIHILRDPLYTIPHHTGRQAFYSKGAHAFMEVLQAYHNFQGDKLLLYYEDFMTKEELEPLLHQIADLLGTGKENIEEFMKDYNLHTIRCKMLYNHVRGNKTFDVKLEEREKWVEYFKSHDLYETYLKRYF